MADVSDLTEREQERSRPVTEQEQATYSPPIVAAAVSGELPAISQPKLRGRPFQPGQSGNPSGRRKKGETLTDILKDKADKRKLADALLALAYRGDVAALRYVYDRIEGTPVQRTEDVTPAQLHTWAVPIASALGVPVEDVLLQYEQLKQLPPG